MGILQARILEWVAISFSRDPPNPGIKPRSPLLQADSLLSEPPGKTMNNGVSSLSLLQGIFPTQVSNQGLLHCRRILYHLSYHGSPPASKDPLSSSFLASSFQYCSGFSSLQEEGSQSPQSSTVLQDTQALNLYSSSIIGRLLVIHACRQKYIKDDM